MEDAKIQQSEGNQQERFPSVITTDDLVFELGKDVIDKLNKEKLLNSLLKKSKALEEQLEQLKAIPQKLEELQASNKLYEKKNRELGDELTKVRQESNTKTRELSAENKKLSDELITIQQDLDEKVKEVKKLSTKNRTTTPKKSASKSN